MKYENAKDVLPEEIFEEVQKYAAGKLLYFPVIGERSPWGAKSGNRFKNEKRNQEIRRLYGDGYSLDQLAERYFLTPESIKNIIYTRKGTKMNLDEVFALYEDEKPLAYKLTSQIDEMQDWGEYYFITNYLVTFPGRKLMIRIQQYPFATQTRLAEQEKTAAAYEAEGLRVCRMATNRYGELSTAVSYEGHDCVVFAEEVHEDLIPSSDASPKTPGGRFLYTDELLTVAAKIGQRHLEGNEPNYAVLYDNTSACFKEYEDWIHEYTEADLPNRIREKQPDLFPVYEKINAELRRVREDLRPLYKKLPRSVFHGEERGESILLDKEGHLVGLCDFTDGGADVCVNHFLCLAMQMDEILPEDYTWLAVHDPEADRRRVESVVHALKVIGKEYTWSGEELTALPLLYKLMLFGRPYYYGTLFGLMNDHDKLKEMLEFILEKVSGGDEIDFERELGENEVTRVAR